MEALTRQELEEQFAQLKAAIQESEAARQQAVAARQQAVAARQQAVAALQQTESALLPTTLFEYLDLLRRYSPNPKVQQKSKCTQGDTTSPDGRYMPKFLRHWEDFLDEQEDAIELLKRIIPEDARLFKSARYMQEMGDELAGCIISSELDIGIYASKAVEEPVRWIFLAMQREFSETAASINVHLGFNFRFVNHPNSLQNDEGDRPPFDRACIIDERPDEEAPRMILGAEYKAPHKFTYQHIRAGLKEMDLDDIVNRVHIPTGDEAHFVHRSEVLMAAGLTQLYDYMARAGQELGYFYEGRTIIFIKVDWKNPDTLYYHIAEPVAEAEAHSAETAPYHTAVCQVLLFCLMAIQRSRLDYSTRRALCDNLPKWKVDENRILAEINSSSSDQQSSSSFQESLNSSNDNQTPRMTRSRSRTCNPKQPSGSRDPSRTPSPDSSSPPRKRPRNEHISSGSSSKLPQKKRSMPSKPSEQEFCSHECIQTLIKREPPDKRCPNFAKHFQAYESLEPSRHPFARSGLLDAVLTQFDESGLDDGCVYITRGGYSLVYEVTLRSHGYKFIAKGTNKTLMPHLFHEYKAYCILHLLQGSDIPVCLGYVKLPCPRYHLLDEISHMLFMSWAGSSTTPAKDEKYQLLQKLKDHGVVQRDVHDPNFCRGRSGGLFAIDFGDVDLIKKHKSKTRLLEYCIEPDGQAMRPLKRLMPARSQFPTA